eukprot:5785624-Heterocapsa_arctica.AAC.1
MMHLVCSLAASMKLKLHGDDVIGAFLQDQKIECELYFRLPRNLGHLKIPEDQEGDVLCEILLGQGWKKLSFESGSFVHRTSNGEIDTVYAHGRPAHRHEPPLLPGPAEEEYRLRIRRRWLQFLWKRIPA